MAHAYAVATKFALTGSGEWREVIATLADGEWDHRLGGGDLARHSNDGTDTGFHLIEFVRQ